MQAWLLALVVLPSRSHISIRLGVIAILVVITIWGLPHHVWQVLQTLCLWLKPFHPSSQTRI
jgi:hypothetical protein